MKEEVREAALALSEDILSNIELNDITLSAIMLKCARLARLLGDEDSRKLFSFEAGGYPSTPDGIPSEAFEFGRRAGRVYIHEEKDKARSERMKTSSVESLEHSITANKVALAAAADPDVSISSANPNQVVYNPQGNSTERSRISNAIFETSKTLGKSRSIAYEYAASAQYELGFSKVASSIFDRISEQMGLSLLTHVPHASQKTSSISDNIQSENPEDWANAVHSCRRLLQEVADAIFPPSGPRVSGDKTIKLGAENYINRLIAFIEDNSDSDRFREIVGSTLGYIGERLDSVFKAAQKGSHASIRTREEAERYVIYTYMTVGDILALKSRSTSDEVVTA